MVQVCFSEGAPLAGRGGGVQTVMTWAAYHRSPDNQTHLPLNTPERGGAAKREKKEESRGRSDSLSGFIPEEDFFFHPFLEKKKKRTQINGSHLLATLEMKPRPRWHRCHTEVTFSLIAICCNVIGQWPAAGSGGGAGGGRREEGGDPRVLSPS